MEWFDGHIRLRWMRNLAKRAFLKGSIDVSQFYQASVNRPFNSFQDIADYGGNSEYSYRGV
jgi:hypothetical protein